MNETQALDMAAGALSDLAGVRDDTAKILSLLQEDASEVPSSEPLEVEVVNTGDFSPLSDAPVEAAAEVAVPGTFFDDLMSFQYMQVSLSVVVVVALLLNFGAVLWLSFSRNWRS